jgi:hypothetical protein
MLLTTGAVPDGDGWVLELKCCAARRPVVSPAQPGGTRRIVLGSNGFTRIRKVKGTIACQESDDQAQVSG